MFPYLASILNFKGTQTPGAFQKFSGTLSTGAFHEPFIDLSVSGAHFDGAVTVIAPQCGQTFQNFQNVSTVWHGSIEQNYNMNDILMNIG